MWYDVKALSIFKKGEKICPEIRCEKGEITRNFNEKG